MELLSVLIASQTKKIIKNMEYMLDVLLFLFQKGTKMLVNMS